MGLLYDFLVWFLDYNIMPRVSFSSGRLAYRPLDRAEIPALCNLFTLACVAEMSPDGRDLSDPSIFRASNSRAYLAWHANEIVGFIGFYGEDHSFGFWVRQSIGGGATPRRWSAPSWRIQHSPV
jgi:hypothetical protein